MAERKCGQNVEIMCAEDTNVRCVLRGEDNMLGNALRYILMIHPDVKFFWVQHSAYQRKRYDSDGRTSVGYESCGCGCCGGGGGGADGIEDSRRRTGTIMVVAATTAVHMSTSAL